ncbi:hypothetical protein [Paludisphaera soli]|uniref:hypothetical protein n=1 Tax=Paludisphaera soli TaxID=2712865 RepID=UPI0013EAA5D9|nr:hypothetical protein [Paludisphaera soli]
MGRLDGSCDPRAAERRADRPARLARAGLVAAVGLAGVLAVHHPMLLSGFRSIQTDLVDSRLLHYLLEHGWLWATGDPGHSRLWDPPFFHPVPNVLAFTDSMVGYAPLYWPWRLAGFAPETAFGIWMVTATVLNYAAGVLLFHDGLKFRAAATAAGAGLLAFGAPRVSQLQHQQLLPFFYVILSLYALRRVFREPDPGPGERAACWVAAGLGAAMQFYGGVYLGWFYVASVGAATAVGLASRTSRGPLLEVLARDWWAVAAGLAAAGVALVPFLAHYLPAAREYASGFNHIQRYTLARPWSWWSLGEANWFWGWVERRWPREPNPFLWEHHLSVGYLTTAACVLGLLAARGRPLPRVAIGFTVLVLATMTTLPNPGVILAAWAAIAFALGLLFREPDWSERGAAALVATTALLAWLPPINAYVVALTVTMIVLCLGRVFARRGRIDEQILPAAAATLLVWRLLPIATTATMAAMFAPAAALAGYYLPARRGAAAFAAVAASLAATAWLMFENRPWILVGGTAGALIAWASASVPPERLRLGSRGLAWLLAVAFAIVVVIHGHDSFWTAFSPWIPGSLAIRVPARVALVLLVPAALGLAILVERLDRGRWGAAAWGVALVCLAEQTSTSPTFEVTESRARIAEVSRDVRPDAEAFYYEPVGANGFILYGLDAMWASIQTGVPTINGYSGCFPTDWRGFALVDTLGYPPTEVVLQRWCAKYGLDPDRVQWLNRREPSSPPQGDEVPASAP